MHEVAVSFPGGKRVDAQIGAFVVHTDQPVDQGGDATAVGPFDLFLASLATCAGLYVLAFCQARGLSTDGLALHQHTDVDPATRIPNRIRIEVVLPPSFPERYRAAVVRAAEGCKVKKTLAAAPAIDVVAVPSERRPHPSTEVASPS
jgi:ribosomal protein S12 methylthiotransferase accessory factor